MANGQEALEVQAIVDAIQSEGLSWEAGATPLTELSAEERRSHLGLHVTEEELQQMAAATQMRAEAERQSLGAVGAPAAFDWRNVNGSNYVTSVKNQGGCGSCVSFCTCAVMESAVRIKLQNPGNAIDLSEAFLFNCGGGSCQNGWGLTSGLDFAKSTGVTDEACMPYQAVQMNCNSRCSDWQNRLTKVASYAGHSSMEARKNAIATIGPVLAGMAVYNDFFAYRSGVYVKTNNTLAGYHCICVVGYDDAQQCWIIKNSWGTGWGDGGFGRIRYGQADLLIDSSWQFYSAAVEIKPGWHGNLAVSQTYASRDSQNAWAHFQGMGWRRISTGSPDGVTNMLALFAKAVASNKKVTVYTDADFVYQGYLL
ncbi:MAG: C1 family peptidase [Actinomycetota bacterium]|nr:C1 family peptidase [Actinomycetota bacterium]